MTNPVVRHFPDKTALFSAAAEYVLTSAAEAVGRSGVFTFVLSGGSTPAALYELLASPEFSLRMPWDATHIFWGDERMVPPDHDDSNFRMARETLLSRVPVPEGNIHRIEGENGADDAADAYEREIVRFFTGRDADYSVTPSFDLILLGMGGDGHTASLFPGDAALGVRDRIVTTAHAPDYMPVGSRVTLSLPALNAAERVLFLVSGEAKQAMLERVLSESGRDTYPAGMVFGTLETCWFTDFESMGK